MPLIYLFSSQAHYHPHLLPSFPTRRSSDLILAPGGVLFTSSCSYHVSRDIFNAMLADAARDSGRRIQLLAATGASSDQDRKSTRLNSSHRCISYAVFCLKKKKTKKETYHSI